ncbi:MAG: hypothetical protein ACLFQX_00315 [Candidatus Kapaibacterium sp.]
MAEKNNPKYKGREIFKEYSQEIIQRKKTLLTELKRLWKAGKKDLLIEHGLAEIEKLPKEPSGQGDKDIAEIYLIIATAIWETTEAREKVLPLVRTAAEFDRMNKGIMWLLREAKGEYSPDAKYFKIDAGGKCPYAAPDGGIQMEDFITFYAVVAESCEEALGIIREYERLEVRDSIEIRSCKEVNPAPELPKGIYQTMNLLAIRNEDDQEKPPAADE